MPGIGLSCSTIVGLIKDWQECQWRLEYQFREQGSKDCGPTYRCRMSIRHITSATRTVWMFVFGRAKAVQVRFKLDRILWILYRVTTKSSERLKHDSVRNGNFSYLLGAAWTIRNCSSMESIGCCCWLLVACGWYVVS